MQGKPGEEDKDVCGMSGRMKGLEIFLLILSSGLIKREQEESSPPFSKCSLRKWEREKKM